LSWSISLLPTHNINFSFFTTIIVWGIVAGSMAVLYGGTHPTGAVGGTGTGG
jgi:hypothetical protein